MLRSVKDVRGVTVGASDGDIGRVDDLYFDDERWGIRYVVVDTGGWLSARRVLISPIAFGPPDWRSQRLPVALTKEQLRNSPDIDTQRPVSRQHEAEYARYFGYPYYWVGAGLWGMGAEPRPLVRASAQQPDVDARLAQVVLSSPPGDSHLRSCAAVTGYHIEATDGAIGHVADFIVDDHSWEIHYVVVDTSNWWLGHRVMFARNGSTA